VIKLAGIAAFNQMRQVTHGRHESIGERGHVAHIRALGRIGHLHRFGVIHRQGLFAKDVFSLCDCCERDRRMERIRCGDDHRMDVIAVEDVFVVTRHDCHAGLRTGAFQNACVGVAQRHDFYVRADGKTRQMILQRDSAAADNAEVDDVCSHDVKVWRTSRPFEKEFSKLRLPKRSDDGLQFRRGGCNVDGRGLERAESFCSRPNPRHLCLPVLFDERENLIRHGLVGTAD